MTKKEIIVKFRNELFDEILGFCNRIHDKEDLEDIEVVLRELYPKINERFGEIQRLRDFLKMKDKFDSDEEKKEEETPNLKPRNYYRIDRILKADVSFEGGMYGVNTYYYIGGIKMELVEYSLINREYTFRDKNGYKYTFCNVSTLEEGIEIELMSKEYLVGNTRYTMV